MKLGGSLSVVVVTLLAAFVATLGWMRFTPRGQDREEGGLERLGSYDSVPTFTLTERSGREVRLDDLRGKIWVANFFYTSCTDTCPLQSAQLRRLQDEFADSPDLRLVSITVDPKHDTPAVLRRYAERYRADPTRWLFLTGPKPAIYALATDGFKLGVADAGPAARSSKSAVTPAAGPGLASQGAPGPVMHSSRFVLVDRQGKIRAYHRTDDPEALAQLRENLRRLLAKR